MKIVRKNINSSTDIDIEKEEVIEDPSEELVEKTEVVEEVVDTCPYCSAIEHIHAAIEDLGQYARTDELARESIANLSVVLFDLKS